MLIQPHDRDDDPGRWRSFVTHQGFGHLVASGTGRDVPVVSPTQFVLLVDPAEHGAKLQAIRGIRLAIDDVRAKYKFGGNVDQRHRDAVEARLLERDGPGDRAALAHLRRT